MSGPLLLGAFRHVDKYYTFHGTRTIPARTYALIAGWRLLIALSLLATILWQLVSRGERLVGIVPTFILRLMQV